MLSRTSGPTRQPSTTEGASTVLYLEVLKSLHDRLSPTTYLEIGVSHGASLALATCRTVGIDPAFFITEELDGDIALVRSSSDDFFATRSLAALTRGLPVDLAFIDGMHLFECALRDFINVERHASARSVIVIDDILPRDADEAAWGRHTQDWTGDVFRLTEVLRRYRPDLIVLPLDAEPTGTLLVAGLDPESRILVESYDAILAEYRQPDPQWVPTEVLDRIDAVPAHRVLESDLLEALAERSNDASAWRDTVIRSVLACAGPAFANSAS
jgi:hypothetical protein